MFAAIRKSAGVAMVLAATVGSGTVSFANGPMQHTMTHRQVNAHFGNGNSHYGHSASHSHYGHTPSYNHSPYVVRYRNSPSQPWVTYGSFNHGGGAEEARLHLQNYGYDAFSYPRR